MKTTFKYKGYRGSIKISADDNCLYGLLMDISDLVTYEAETVADLRREFMAAVDDYLETCQRICKEPQTPVMRPRKSSTSRLRQSSSVHL